MFQKRAPKTSSIADAWHGALRPMIVGEADHRVKSSLQCVASLLQLQATDGALTRPDEALADAAVRIKAVAHWQAFLSQTRNGGRRAVALDDYLHALVDHFVDVFAAPSRIVLLVNADPIQVPPGVAGMLGQVVNELVIDAARHAFGPKRTGTIQVECGTDAAGSVVLQVSDDGKEDGKEYANGSDVPASQTFGMQIVTALVKQLGGTFAARKPGARLWQRVTIPMPGRASSASPKRRTRRGQTKERR
jgi:two-component sensor histidine kinase